MGLARLLEVQAEGRMDWLPVAMRVTERPSSLAPLQDKFGKGVGLSLAAVRSYTKQVRGADLPLRCPGRSVTVHLFPSPDSSGSRAPGQAAHHPRRHQVS